MASHKMKFFKDLYHSKVKMVTFGRDILPQKAVLKTVLSIVFLLTVKIQFMVDK